MATLMNLMAQILPPENIMLDLPASSKKRVFEQIGLLLENRCGLAKSVVYDGLFEREKLGSTGLGRGVAVPHARIKGLKQTHCVFVRLSQAIPFDAPDGEPVQLMFVVLGSDRHPEQLLEMWAYVAEGLADTVFRQALLEAADVDTLHTHLINWRQGSLV